MQLTNKQFMTIGMYVFVVIGVANLLSLLITYPAMNIFSIISSIGGIFFNFLIAFMFYQWSRTSVIDQTLGTDEQMKEIEETLGDLQIKKLNRRGC